MKAYHGSHSSGLKGLTYTEENSRFGGDSNLVHGAGIYLTLSKHEAKAYATSSLYTLEITGEIFDATDEEVLQNYVTQLFKIWDVDSHLVENKTIQNLIKQTARGDISGVSFAKNLSDVFSNDIALYSEILQDKFQDNIDSLCEATESSFQYKLIKVYHKGNGTNWIICLDHEGQGIEIVLEEKI